MRIVLTRVNIHAHIYGSSKQMPACAGALHRLVTPSTGHGQPAWCAQRLRVPWRAQGCAQGYLGKLGVHKGVNN